MLNRIKKEIPMLVLVVLSYCIIPNIVLSIPGFDRSENIWIINWVEPFNGVLYFLLVSSMVSFVGGTLAFGHFLNGADFSPSLVFVAAVGVATLFPRMPLQNWIALSFGVVFFAIMECFTLLNRVSPNSHPLMQDLKANRCFLGWLCYLSIGMQLVCHVNATFLVGFHPIPVLILAFCIGILPFFQMIEGPLTLGGLLAVIVMGMVSLLFAWYQCSYPSSTLFLITMIVGYFFLLLVEAGLFLVRKGLQIFKQSSSS